MRLNGDLRGNPRFRIFADFVRLRATPLLEEIFVWVS